MNEIVMGNLLALFSIIMIIVNYVFTSITLFKVSKKEEKYIIMLVNKMK